MFTTGLPWMRAFMHLGELLTKLLLILSLTVLGVQPLAAAEIKEPPAVTPSTIADFFDTLIAQQMADAHVVGATVAVVKDGELLFAKGYGYADLEKKIPVVADQTLFYPGSTGKLLTWTALMQLVETGQVDLAADVNDYLDFTIPATFPEPITIAHLLTHTTGFEEQLAALLVARQRDVQPLADFLRDNLPARVYPPGTTWAYSNYATGLAGYIVERVSGVPYAQYVTDHILTPLAMNHSSVAQPLPAALLSDYAKGYHYRNGQYSSVDFEWVSNLPTGPLRTTATDMANFMLSHLNGGTFHGTRILQESTCVAMQTKQFAHDPNVNGMGYGFMFSTQNGKSIFWHTGGSAYFNTMLALIPEENIGFFVSTNTPIGDLYQPLVRFVDHFYPTPNTAAVAATADPAGAAQRIAALSGSYVSSRVAHESAQKFVTWQAEALTLQPGPDNTLQVGSRRYRETEPGIFRQVDGPRSLTYRTDDQGAVTQIFWGQFAYSKIPWYWTAGNQLLLLAPALAILLSAALAWGIARLVQRRRASGRPAGWAKAARWSAVVVGMGNLALFAWFIVALLGFAESFVYPTATIQLLTWLWWLNVPAVALLTLFTILAWKAREWNVAWRLHYTIVTAASLFLVLFTVNWHLLAGL
ncbi:MAG: beta-lactamase family protein [Caldilineaceae bacterium]|nr:beta-lactamase family protein [Caldilineaceae bacterium]